MPGMAGSVRVMSGRRAKTEIHGSGRSVPAMGVILWRVAGVGHDVVVRAVPVDPRDQRWESGRPAYRVCSDSPPPLARGQGGRQMSGS